jgi:uncharacterized coiled-coil DUF342 family protein
MTMDTEQLRKNFDDQLAQTVKQIGELKENLRKAEEYKIKLEGGIETLNLLNPPEEESAEAPAE